MSIINLEAERILTNSRPYVFPTFTFTLQTETEQLPVQHPTSIRVKKDFVNNLADIINIEFLLPYGTFRDTIYKNKDKLEVTVTKRIFDLTTVYTYKLIILTKLREQFTNKGEKDTTDTLDTQELILIHGQCIDPLLLSLKDLYVSGIFHDITYKDLLKSLFSKEFKDLKIQGRSPEVILNVYEPDNGKEHTNVMVKPFTKLIKLPLYIDKELEGLYIGDVGTYFTNNGSTNISYDVDIFPVYNFERFDNENTLSKLIIVNPTIDNLGSNENDFFYSNKIYRGIVTDLTIQSYVEDKAYDKGTGLATGDVFNLTSMDSFDIQEDKISFKHDNIALVKDIDKKQDFNNYIPGDLDANLYRYTGVFNKNNSIVAIFKFPQINPDVIYPGMPVKYFFSNNNKIVETTGTIHGVEYFSDIVKKTTSVAVIALLNKIKKD